MLLFMFTCISAFSNLSANILDRHIIRSFFLISIHSLPGRSYHACIYILSGSVHLITILFGWLFYVKGIALIITIHSSPDSIYPISKYSYFIWAYTIIIGKWFYGSRHVIFFSGVHFMKHFDLLDTIFSYVSWKTKWTSNGFHLFCVSCVYFFFFEIMLNATNPEYWN